MEEIKQAITAASQELFNVEITPELTRPDEQFGDYATNVAMRLAGDAAARDAGNPREIAGRIAEKLQTVDGIAKVEVAGPGFINLRLTDEAMAAQVDRATTIRKPFAGKTVVAEYSDPNPFKVLHAGHLYTSVVGDAIANLLEATGATVHRVNFGGDVGLHVGKTMWAILQSLGGENPDKLSEIDAAERSEWLTERYVEGNQAYEDDEQAKTAINDLNTRVYQLHTDSDHESAFAHIYWTTRQWSYDYFDVFYARIGTKFEKYYPESTTAPAGLAKAKELAEKGVLKESDGAIVFPGEDFGLHTRVFITSKGLPTYESKDLGLILTKWEDYHFVTSVIITGNDIVEYMKVVLKVVEQFQPELAQNTRHLTHGIVKLQGGQKMSSRKGNILRAEDILDAAAAANQEARGEQSEDIVLGAVKYSFIKQRYGADVIYDPVESVSLEGNSGPYLQYAHARAKSILRKSTAATDKNPANLEPGERSLARKLTEYPEVIDKAVVELMPHHIATYLYELAQAFNSFYENNRVIGSGDRESTRLRLVSIYAEVLKDGLGLLGIAAPEKM